MRAQFIYEKFEEESDPIKDMGIGLSSPRDFQNKNEITKWVMKHMKYLLHVNKIPKDIIMDEDHFIKYEYLTILQQFCAKYFTLQGEKKWVSDIYPDWQHMREIFMNRGYSTVDVPNKYVNEKFEEESDPINDFGIGVASIREFATTWEAAVMFVDNINILTKGAIKSPQELRELQNNIHLGMTITGDPSPLTQCKYYLDGTYLHQPPLTIYELGGRFDRVTEHMQFLKYFKQTVTEYTHNKFKPKTRFAVDEAFHEEGDPIKDMGIGIFALRNFKSKDAFYHFLANNILVIVDLEKLPKDFIKIAVGRWQMKKPFGQIIRDYIKDYVTIGGEHPDLDNVFFISGLTDILDNGVLQAEPGDPDMDF